MRISDWSSDVCSSDLTSAVRVFSPARFSSASATRLSTATATSISISEKPRNGARRSARRMDLHLARRVHGHLDLPPVACQPHSLLHAAAGRLDAEAGLQLPPIEHGRGALGPRHRFERAFVQRLPLAEALEIGRAAGRERGCPYVL